MYIRRIFSTCNKGPSMLNINRDTDSFSIALNENLLISHSPQQPFVYAGTGREKIDMYRGNFDIQDQLIERIPLERLSYPDPTQAPAAASASTLLQLPPDTSFSVHLTSPAGHTLTLSVSESDGRLHLQMVAAADSRPANRWWFRLPAAAGEHVYGGGEQFSHFNLRGRRFPLWSSEQGVGRNKSTPITFQADVQDRCGGDYWWTFFPQPSFVSSQHYYFHTDCSAYAAFDFRADNFHELEFWDLPKSFIFGGAPDMLGVVQDVGRLLGTQPELPEWVHDGIILGIQGGTDICEQKTKAAQAAGMPVCGIWAQDWEGIRMTSFGQRLMWNWQWDPARYPQLPEAIKRWNKEGIRFLGYANPYVAANKALFEEAEAQGFLAKDASGKTYLVDFGEFDAGIPDFTNPAAFEWYKKVMRRELIDLGLSGWMADFGEYLPTDTVLHDGRPAMLAHNEWPALWAKVNHEAVAEAGLQHEITYFMRAGFTGSQRWCPLMWAGDQNVDWSEDDGLLSVIPAALSLAVCGHGLHHSDIGGYTTLYGMQRSKELLLRWTEQAVFTAMMRTHEGNRPKDNWQFDSDGETLSGIARLVQLFVALKPYRKAGVTECSELNIPLMRPLFLHYEQDCQAWLLKDQYLYGRDLLVAPVWQEGAAERQVHLPQDNWVHLWTGQKFSGGEYAVPAPLGLPPVFWRASSKWADLFQAIGRDFGNY
ncbi:MAG: alpha-glucosidase [Spirochaetes bacterium]|nr:alpha-glucosidase [Spirochaetota bacterium]